MSWQSTVFVLTLKLENLLVKFWLYSNLILVFMFQQSDDKLFATGLKMGAVLIPETGLVGGSETFACDFEQESDQELLSLKWFKDGHEFFRYLPHDKEPMSTFNVPGFSVHGANASLNSVTIKSITLNASGIYRCEILADKPSFQTLFKEGNFTVIVPPDPESPRISNISSNVLMGEVLAGNCTSFRSAPPAQLTFHINDEKIESPNVIEYRPINSGLVVPGAGNLQNSVLGLRIKVSHKYFRRGEISIKCTARIGQRSWVTQKVVHHLNNHPSHLSNHGRSKNSAAGLATANSHGAHHNLLITALAAAAGWIMMLMLTLRL